LAQLAEKCHKAWVCVTLADKNVRAPIREETALDIWQSFSEGRVLNLSLKTVVLGFLFWVLVLATSAGELTFLHTRGQDIINEHGEKVLLRGVGLVNWLLPEGYMWKFGKQADRPRRIEKLVSDLIGEENAKHFWSEFRKSYIAEGDIRQIAALGYNSLRPALNARLFVSGATGEPEGFVLLNRLVASCKTNGLYVIIDMHAAPGGQTGQNIDDSENDQPELFLQSRYQDELVALWKKIAQRYQNEPTVAGYDLLNEPLPARTGALAKHKSQLEPLYQRITQAIREVDKRHMIIVEGADWANDWSVFTKPFDPNLVYQFHYYCWDNPAHVNGIDKYLGYRQRFNAPVWVGETGERDNTIYWATTDYFEANNIGWCFWPWKKLDAENCPCSIRRPKDWDAIVAYSRGRAKPEKDVAQKAFDELLVNLRFENCKFHPDVVNAMLRRAPVRIEAENYGRQGAGVSFSVSNTQARSKLYRTDEPVTVMAEESQRPRSSQHIVLSAREWTAYTVDSAAAKSWQIKLRARSESAPAQGKLFVNDRAFEWNLDGNQWREIKLGAAELKPGANQLKFVVSSGTADLDWIALEE
jgi:endoglucanase